MIDYKIKVKNPDDVLIGEFDTYRNLTLVKRLNNYGVCSFEIPVDDDKATTLVALRRFTTWVYRVDDDGEVLVWSGEQALRRGKLGTDNNNWVEIISYDWTEQLNSRFTAAEVTYTATDAGEIAWQLIDTTQTQTNGDLGITEGDIEATMDRDRTYFNQNIMEAIINLSGVLSGFDFEISNDRAFNVYVSKGIDRTDSVIFEYGFNIKTVDIIEDFTAPVNRGIVLGQVVDADNLIREERNDTVLQDLYGIREYVQSEMDVSETETLEEKGDALIRKYGTALLKLDMELLPQGSGRSGTSSIDDFSLGDTIRIIINSGFYDLDKEYRIFEWELKFDDDNVEKLKLILGDFTL